MLFVSISIYSLLNATTHLALLERFYNTEHNKYLPYMSSMCFSMLSLFVCFPFVYEQMVPGGGVKNASLLPHCLLSFVPLRKLMEAVDGEAVLKDLRPYRDVHWFPQQVSSQL